MSATQHIKAIPFSFEIELPTAYTPEHRKILKKK